MKEQKASVEKQKPSTPNLWGAEEPDPAFYVALAQFATELTAIQDLNRLCTFVAQQAAALVDADEAALYLETRPLESKATENALQLTIPLSTKDKVVGLLVLARRPLPGAQDVPPRAFSQADERHLSLLTKVAAVAVVGLQREQALQRRNNWRDRALALLQETGRVMGSTLELTPLMRYIIDVTVKALRAEAGLLALYEGENHLVLRATAGLVSTDMVGRRIEGEQNLMSWVTDHKHSALLTDFEADQRVSAALWSQTFGFEPRTLLAAPLVTKGRTIGAIEVVNKRDGSFDQDDRHLLETLSLSVAATIEGARLHERRQRQIVQQENIVRVGQALSSTKDTDAVLQEVAEAVLSVVPTASTAAVHLLDPASNTLQLHRHAGRPVRDSDLETFSWGEGIAGQVLAAQKLINVGDVTTHPLFVPGSESSAYRSLLVAPLLVEEEPLGTLSVAGLDPNAFGREDEQLVRGLGAQAAVALRNARLLDSLRESESRYARLYAEAKERAKELEAANRRLQDLTRQKTQFIQNTSHELRTPLTFVRGYLELLLSGDLGSLPKEQRTILEIMDVKSQRLVNLVDDIGSLLEMELHPADVQPLNLVNVLANRVTKRCHQARQVGVSLQSQWPETPIMVEGNGHRLAQVFNHLLDNAIKFSPDGGRVRVQVWQQGGDAYVQVSDQGIGIPPQEQERVFERFYQVDGSTTRRFGGTGLGLAIVKETIEAHGGAVTVESSGVEGEGTSFIVRLPLLPPNRDHEQEG